MAHTKYGYLSIDELLRLVEDRRDKSPIIDELCNRLENTEASILPDSNRRVECPICEAELEADYDEANTMFTIKVAS